jgi:V/A-type H+-transporting ATPase subunit D
LPEIKPTRSELIKLKKKIKLADFGHSLLKKKRDGLVKEFFATLKKAKKSKSDLTENYITAKTAIDLARAVDGTATVRSASFALKPKTSITLETRNVMGIIVPKIHSQHKVNAFHERGYGVIGTSGYIDDAAEWHERVLENVITAAETETTLKKLLIAIDKTKRRVNALEFNVIPRMNSEAKFVSLRLEELERDDIFRLKKIKQKTRQ